MAQRLLLNDNRRHDEGLGEDAKSRSADEGQRGSCIRRLDNRIRELHSLQNGFQRGENWMHGNRSYIQCESHDSSEAARQ